MPELVPLSDDEYESLMKLMINWLLIGLGAVLLFVITQLLVYFKLIDHTMLGFLMIIQLGIVPVAAFYCLKLRKLIKELKSRARNA